MEVLGRLRTRQRRRGEFIHPFVCLLDAGAPLLLQEAEVEELFSVPLGELLEREFGEARIVEEYSLGPSTLEDVYIREIGRADALENI